ncbi:MAG: hypothetical protein ABIK09_07110 [Pseudomonadota bacterium]
MSLRPRQIAGILLLTAAAVLAAAAAAAEGHLTTADLRDFLPRGLVLAEAFAALGISCWLVFRRRSGFDRRILIAGALITGIALALRLLVPTWAFFHENRHGYRYFIEIVTGQPGYLPPSTYYVLMHALTRCFAPDERTLFFVNALFSAAAVPLVGVVARQVSGRALAGWAAMGLWALSPHALRLATTETYFNVGVFFLLAGSAATIHALRRLEGERLPVPELLLAVTLSALAAQTRALTLLWPASIMLLAYGAGAISTRRQWRAAGAGALALSALMVPKLLSLLEGGAGQGRLFDPKMVVTALPSLTLFDQTVISPLLPPLALAGMVLLLRRGGRLGLPATFVLTGLFAFPATAFLRTLMENLFLEGSSSLLDLHRAQVAGGIYLGMGTLLTLLFVWFTGRTPRGAPTGRGVSLRGLSVIAAVLLPLVVSMTIENRLVSSLRFDLAPHALVTILGGVGIAGLTALLPEGRWAWVRRALPVVLVLTALGPVGLARRPFADPVEHRFLREVVIPTLDEVRSPLYLVVPMENDGSGRIKLEWWQTRLDDPRVVEDLREVPPEARREAWAFIGYTCYWDHAEPPAPHPMARHVEGHPRIHPRCAAALSGTAWRAVATLTLPRWVSDENVRPFPDHVEQVTLGLYRATPTAP